MGLLDDLRMATGLALEPLEAYERAYTKGVLLGPSHFAAAATLFREAAEKLRSADVLLAARAQANASVYDFLSSNDPGAAQRAAQQLGRLPHIEAPGTQTEVLDAPLLAHELAARALELRAQAQQGAAAVGPWLEAAHAWVPLFDRRLRTFGLAGDEPYADLGSTRFFLAAGQAARHRGEALFADDPDAASEQFALAIQAFLRCGAEPLAARVRERLSASRTEKACWFCGQVVRGFGPNLCTMSAPPSGYFRRVLAANPERGPSYNPHGGIYACTVCAGAVDAVAAARAGVVREELTRHMTALAQQLTTLQQRVQSLEGSLRLLGRL